MTSMRLTYVPIPGSHHVYLNGLEMREGTDWSDDGTGLLTFAAPFQEISGDKVEVLYAHLGEAVIVTDPVLRDTGSSSANGTAHDYPVPSGALVSDLVLMAFFTTSILTSVPAGWSLLQRVDFGSRHLWVLAGVASGGGSEVFHATWDGTGASVKYMSSVVLAGGAVADSDGVGAVGVSTFTTASVVSSNWTMHVVASSNTWTFDTLTPDIGPGAGNPTFGWAHEVPGSGVGTGITVPSGVTDIGGITVAVNGV
jgi:hypothetical protein